MVYIVSVHILSSRENKPSNTISKVEHKDISNNLFSTWDRLTGEIPLIYIKSK